MHALLVNLDMLLTMEMLQLEFVLGKIMKLNTLVQLTSFGINLLTQTENVFLKLPTALLDIQLMELLPQLLRTVICV